ncbi:hypothetical protein ScalyP_jg1239 [Parmales sp. scaly parma]|nr:hypothetical protein ScalyP_jg1239 [Parmales sp. scaly parma]
MRAVVHLFQFDLRLHDNPALCAAISYATSSGVPFLPFFCFDSRSNNNKSPARSKFLIESVRALNSSLNGNLHIVKGITEERLKSLNPIAVFTQQEFCRDERIIVDRLNASRNNQKSPLVTEIWGSSCYELADLPFGLDELPNVFTPFRNKVEKGASIKSPLPPPDLSKVNFVKIDNHDSESEIPPLPEFKVDPRGVMEFVGGEDAALKRVQQYIWTEDRLKDYFTTRNEMIGQSYSSKFSPWLALGCLSPRYVVGEAQRYEKERVENKSTYWIVFELLVRDFCRFVGARWGDRIFLKDGLLPSLNKTANHNWVGGATAKTLLDAWKTGTTGYPFVDANMRELKATGYQSNRGRQNVASFLVFDLKLDWRNGAKYFEEVLLDYDIYSNYVSWIMAAGVSGGRVNKFNTEKQGNDYDKEGDYVKLWCPELSNVPPKCIHSPWKMSKTDLADCGLKLGVDYPSRVVGRPGTAEPSNNAPPKSSKSQKEKYKGGSYKFSHKKSS